MLSYTNSLRVVSRSNDVLCVCHINDSCQIVSYLPFPVNAKKKKTKRKQQQQKKKDGMVLVHRYRVWTKKKQTERIHRLTDRTWAKGVSEHVLEELTFESRRFQNSRMRVAQIDTKMEKAMVPSLSKM